MGGASDYLRDKLNDHVNNPAAPYTAPTTMYLALLKDTATSGDTPAGTPEKEVIDQVVAPGTAGYARQVITFGASSGGVALNTNTVTHGAATVDWAEATDFWITDHLTAGNVLYWGTLASPKTVENTGSLIHAIGEASVTVA